MKIVITGGLGYIGTELCKIYSGESRYKDITVIDNRFASERVNQLRDWGINFVHGDGVVIGIISSSDDEQEQAKAVKAGAQFWIIKSDEIEPRLEEFVKDFEGYKERTASFKVYRW